MEGISCENLGCKREKLDRLANQYNLDISGHFQ